jgi:hypothetical protein
VYREGKGHGPQTFWIRKNQVLQEIVGMAVVTRTMYLYLISKVEMPMKIFIIKLSVLIRQTEKYLSRDY